VIEMGDCVDEHFLLNASCVDEINALLSKYYNCIGCDEAGGRFVKGGCDECDVSLTHDEDDAAYDLTSVFDRCMEMGFLKGGK